MRSRVASLVGVVVLGVTLASATQNPTPFVNQPLIPASVAPGGAGFTLTVNGTGFVSGSTVNWNGSPRTTTFVSGSQVTASILSSDIASAATASVTVVSPAPGAGTSNVVFLPVREPATFVSLNAASFGAQLITEALTVGDFNKDGKQDMAVTLYDQVSGTYSVSILLGNGDGTFVQSAESPVYRNAEELLNADVNGDGNLDVIVPDLIDPRGNEGIGVLLGNGDGTFRQLAFYAANAYGQAALGDFNHDGAIDVAIADTQNDQGLCVFPGNGDGSFRPLICTETHPVQNLGSVTVGDFNSDGKLDVALTGLNGSNGVIVIMLGNGDGTFQYTQTYPVNSAGYLTTADFNGDGKLDLAVTDYRNNQVVVFLGRGDGTFQTPTSFASVYGSYYVHGLDMNGDGKLDLVVWGGGFSNLWPSVSVLLGNGDGTFQDYTSYGASEVRDFSVGDFNNDGRLDVAVTNSNFNTITILTQDDGSVVGLSANKLTFPLQLLGTVSDPKLIVLTNTGSSAITISRIDIDANFSQLNNCKTVQPGHTCKIVVYFTPTLTGTLTGYLAIADNGGGSPQMVALSGIATIVSISPGRLDFGNWPVGHISTSQKVVVTNEGNGSMNITQIGIVGPNSKDFSEVNACPGKLAAGASCTISVIFHPSAKGARSATLGIVDSGGGSPQKVPLTGTGT